VPAGDYVAVARAIGVRRKVAPTALISRAWTSESAASSRTAYMTVLAVTSSMRNATV
jgi:hypothetical protein